MQRQWFTTLTLSVIAFAKISCLSLHAEFTAGATVTNVTPKKLPVFVNGSMTSRSVDTIKTPVNARSIAMSDGENTIVIVVVDSCMMPRDLLDKAKMIAAEKAGIPNDHILISATHTHTAPSCVGALGTDADPAYVIFLTKKLVDAILAPLKNLEPAEVGFGSIEAGDYTALRRWAIRPDRMTEDPFGNFTGRANMHAANNWDNVTGQTGPEDPQLSVISFRSTAAGNRPIAVLANFSMHYFGDKDISADYFGLFSEGLKDRIQPEAPAEGTPAFVAMMSHGCSGDIWRRDFSQEPDARNDKLTIEEYSEQMIGLAKNAYDSIEYSVPESIAMSERRMMMNYRVPDKQRLEWALKIVAEMGDRLPKTKEEIYAREQVILNERQNTQIVVQGLRIGDKIGIATTPNETYAISGLKVKTASPLPHTIVIELANGGDGYIPPPEQHLLGGYNTWEARSAGLEVTAEPKIVEAAIQLLEEVSETTRLSPDRTPGPAAQATLDLEPAAYWRLDEFSGPRAVDSSPNHLDAIYEPQVLYYLEGPENGRFATGNKRNRAVHFAGDRLEARIPGLGQNYSISLWLWNGMPNSGREETGWMFSRGRNFQLGDEGEHLGIGGTSGFTGVLKHLHGADDKEPNGGKTPIDRWTWYHLVFVRQGENVAAYLNGNEEFRMLSPGEFPADMETIYFGGRCDDQFGFEGRMDEIAVWKRALTPEEIKKLFAR